ncbi:MAG: hypothetical protein HOH58_07065 [Opitutaceae bacterium]|jgi:anti-sigma factor RsiW|nr:hypothetical protein [Opitutaceae bacterium]
MNCRDAETKILASRDAPLGAADEAILAQHLQECPQCQVLTAQLTAAVDSWRARHAQVEVPDPTTEWHAVRRRIRSGEAKTVGGGLPSWSRLLRVALPMTAAFAIAINFWPAPTSPDSPLDGPLLAHRESGWDEMHEHFTYEAHAEFVETEDQEVSPFVYVDEESGWLIVWASEVPETPSI